MRILLCSALILTGITFSTASHAQFGLFGKNYKIKKNPSSATYNLNEEDHKLVDGQPKDKGPWIVYSDQANNITYKKPGGDVQFKALSFMEPCYVIGTSGDYLELAKYDPSQKINGRKISKKGTDNLGWINKSRVLLWSNAVKDQESKYAVKAITAYRGEKAFSILPGHVANDSLVLFASPFLKAPVGKCSMEDIFYIYKQSPSGNEYLVGASPHLFADSATGSRTGWISKDLIRIWGTRSLFVLDDNRATGGKALTAQSFYSDSSFQKEEQKVPLMVADNQPAFNDYVLERVYPINGFYRGANGTELIKTAVMTDALDRSLNEVYNISGNKITYNEFRNIEKDNAKLNIVFVVDGGSDNAKYMTQLYTILQNLELQLSANPRFHNIHIGSVVYKDNLKGCRNAIAPLTANFKDITDFWSAQQKESFNCNDSYSEQAVFSGLAEASGMLYKHKDESNILVLFGAAGNNSNSGSSWSDVISKLSFVNARLLIFQSHSLSDPAFNNFVVQAKDLVLQSASNIADLKKEKIVDYSASILSSADFSLVGGDSGVYYLNYPNKAMTQGYILFPDKGEVMSSSLLSSNLDSLITQVSKDNKLIESSLFRYFLTIGAKNTRVENRYAYAYPNYTGKFLPADFLKSNTFRTQSFYIPAWTSIQSLDSNRNMKTGLLLNTEEYLQLTSRLQTLAGKKKYGNDRGAIYDQITKAVKQTIKERGIEPAKPISDLTFSEALEIMTGYRSLDPVWLTTPLKTFKQSNAVSLDDGRRFLEESARKASWLQDNMNNSRIQFSNNGRTYYLLTSDKLPGNI